jgi:hypothetical protein
MRARDIVARLEAVQPLRLQAIELIVELDDLAAAASNTETLLDYQEAIDEAIGDLEEQAAEAEKLRKRCFKLPPIPSRGTPLGF